MKQSSFLVGIKRPDENLQLVDFPASDPQNVVLKTLLKTQSITWVTHQVIRDDAALIILGMFADDYFAVHTELPFNFYHALLARDVYGTVAFFKSHGLQIEPFTCKNESLTERDISWIEDFILAPTP